MVTAASAQAHLLTLAGLTAVCIARAVCTQRSLQGFCWSSAITVSRLVTAAVVVILLVLRLYCSTVQYLAKLVW